MKPATTARERILDTAGGLFFRAGYRAVGIDTIVAESGVAKMTLYRHFSSKDALIEAYLEASNAYFWQWFEGIVAPLTGQPEAQLLAFFRALEGLVTQPACYGCPFLNAASEFPELEHPAHRTALAHKRAVRERFRALLEAAGRSNPATLADELMLVMDGAFMAIRMFGADNPALRASTAARRVLSLEPSADPDEPMAAPI